MCCFVFFTFLALLKNKDEGTYFDKLFEIRKSAGIIHYEIFYIAPLMFQVFICSEI